ncbi:MAG: hypothetical protein PHX83_12985 [Acidobacteriia bacterium]|nr:hypothetical protein [Terriglobia bacterium]
MDKRFEIIQEIETLLQELKECLSIDRGEVKRKSKAKTSHDGITGKFSGLTAEIVSLVQEDYFKGGREISEIVNKLHQRAINKPSTTLMKPLRFLVRKRILYREKPGGKGHYKYFKMTK